MNQISGKIEQVSLGLIKPYEKNAKIHSKSQQGKSITCPANMSFSAASTGLNVGDNHRVTYKLKIKGGTKGAGMWIGDSRINEWGARQREFMTNRDSVFKVGRVTRDKNRNITVELEYQCGLEHDYGKK